MNLARFDTKKMEELLIAYLRDGSCPGWKLSDGSFHGGDFSVCGNCPG